MGKARGRALTFTDHFLNTTCDIYSRHPTKHELHLLFYIQVMELQRGWLNCSRSHSKEEARVSAEVSSSR